MGRHFIAINRVSNMHHLMFSCRGGILIVIDSIYTIYIVKDRVYLFIAYITCHLMVIVKDGVFICLLYI